MPRHPAHDTESSSSRAGPPAHDGTVTCPKREREQDSAPPAHFNEARAE
jgi:hypothetical protein